MPGLKDRLVDAGYGFAWTAVCRMPESWAAALFRSGADIAWRRQGPRVRVLESNLLRVLGPQAAGPELRALSRESMRSYGRYWMEVFRLPVMPSAQLVDGMIETGQVEKMLGHLEGGRGVVIPLPHMGNWDQAGAWVIGRGPGTFTTVMERLKPESVYERFVAFREGLGMEVLPATGGNNAFGVLAQRLRAGGLVALPCDRDVTGGGIEVDFFGEKALMMSGPAALAVQTGAALMPATLWFADGCWGVRIHPEIPVPAEGSRRDKAAAMTQAIARTFEEGIREHPGDWHMLQRVFVADLDTERLAASRARSRAAANGAADPLAGAATAAAGETVAAPGQPAGTESVPGEGGSCG